MSFAQGTSVALTATAGSGQSFSGWSGACSGTGTCTVMLNADTAVTAQFAAAPVTTPPTTPPPTVPPPTTPPPTPDDCAGLLPAALPAPVLATLPQSECLDAAADDGAGNYLLGFMNSDGPSSFPEYLFFTLQNGKAAQTGDPIFGGDESSSYIYSQPSGFTLFEIAGIASQSFIKSYSAAGAQQSTQQLAPPNLSLNPVSSAGIDPSGGTAAAYQVADSSTNAVSTLYQRFDKTGAPETRAVLIDAQGRAPNGIGVALSGHALVMVSTDRSGWQARWLAKDGSAITDWFAIANPQPGVQLFPVIRFLLDGNVVIGFSHGSQGVVLANLGYKYEILDGKTSVNAPPAWLQARSNDPFFAIRGGRGYAAFSPSGSCVEALTPAGKSCGCLNVPSLSGHASVGRDGSLMVSEPPQNFGKCTWDLYPQLLK